VSRSAAQLALPVTDPLSDAVEWAEKNPDAFYQIFLWAIDDIDHGSRPSIGLYAELLRRPHFANRLRLTPSDQSYLINNNLRANIARLINREYPKIAFPTREAKADRMNLMEDGDQDEG
jgi:hypothetical protein